MDLSGGWLELVGAIHDLGKVLALPPWGALPQWSVVGDTFPVGHPFSPHNLMAEDEIWRENPDLATETRYCPGVGLRHIHMSWGHDEYLASILAAHPTCTLPPHAIYIIRFHSFYPWHSPRSGTRAYTELADAYDWQMLPLLKAFQRADLYSKQRPHTECDPPWERWNALWHQYLGEAPLRW